MGTFRKQNLPVFHLPFSFPFHPPKGGMESRKAGLNGNSELSNSVLESWKAEVIPQ
jgi:hypothetical protein